MSDYGVVSKGEYLHKQSSEFLHVNRFLVLRRKSGRYLLLDLENLHVDTLTGMTLQVDQLDARGHSLGFVNAEFNDLKIVNGKFVLKEKIKVHRACLDVRVKVLRAEYGSLVYRLGDNDTFATIEKKQIRKPISKKTVEKEVGEEGYIAVARRFKTPVFIGIFAFILALVCFASIFLHLKDFSTKQDSFFLSNLVYEFVDEDKSKEGGVYVSGFIGLGGESIVIPSEVDGYPVIKVAKNAFKGNSRIQTLTVNGNVLIESSAFADCKKLEKVTLNGVSTVEESAFANCRALEEVNVNKVSNLGNYVFENCSALDSVLIEDLNAENVLNMGLEVFKGCGDVAFVKINQFVAFGENVAILQGIDEVESLYLKNYDYFNYDIQENPSKPIIMLFGKDLVSVAVSSVEISYMDYIPAGFAQGLNNSIKSFAVGHLKDEMVAEGAFEDCRLLSSFTAPIKITELGDRAFKGTALEEFDLSSLSTMGESAFEDCIALKSVKTTANTPLKAVAENAFKGCTSLSAFSVPVAVSELGKSAFKDSGLTKIEFAENNLIVDISESVFENCVNLASVKIPSGVEAVGDKAFMGCSILSEVGFPESLKTIKDQTFADCTALSSVNLPLGVLALGAYAFAECSEITEFIVPDTVTELGGGLLSGCNAITSLTSPFVGDKQTAPTKTNLGFLFAVVENDDYDNPVVKSDNSVVPSSLTTLTLTKGGEILSGAFKDCKNIKTFNIPATVRHIKSEAFSGCSAIRGIVLPEGLTEIHSKAFYECVNLRSVTLPGDVYSVQTDSFEECFRLFEVVNVSAISDSSHIKSCFPYALAIYSSTDESTHMEKVTVNGYVFAKTFSDEWYLINHSDVGEIVLPDHPSADSYQLPNRYFYEDLAVTAITLSGEVAKLGDREFSGSTNLTSVVFDEGGTLEIAGNVAFENCSSLKVLDMGARTVANNSAFISTNISSCNAIEDISLPYGFTSFDGSWFSGNTTVKNVVLPSSVSTLYENAFKGCSSLKSVIMRGVESINSYAFANCGSLERVVAPSTKTVYTEAFKSCSSLKEIDVSSAENVYQKAFVNCSSLTSIDLPNLITLGSNAFENCSSLQSFNMADTITSLGTNVFKSCTSLKRVTVSSGLSKLGEGTFSGCTNLTSVTIPGAIKTLDNNVFYGCTALVTINLNQINSVANNVFSGCSSLSTVDNLSNVSLLGENVFNGCIKLNNVTLSSHLTSIPAYTFKNCASLTTITITSSVENISVGAFNGCAKLYSISFSGNTRNLEIANANIESDYVFGGTSLNYLGDNNRIKKIGNNAFRGLTTLSNVELSGVTSIGDYAFAYCSNLGSLTLSSVDTIGNSAFNSCVKLSSLGLSEIATIGDYSFSKCSALQTLYVSGSDISADSIGAYAFSECTKLTSATVNKFYSIKNNAFEKCSSLTKVDLSNCGSVGSSAFSGCKKLEQVNLTNAGTIENYAFYNCEKLIDLTLTGVDKINDNAFQHCTSLNELWLSSDLSTQHAIGQNAFEGCYSLEIVYILNGGFTNSSTINSSAFNNCYNLHEIYNYSSYSITPGENSDRFGDLAYYALVVNTSSDTPRLKKATVNGFNYKYNSNNAWLVGYEGNETKITVGDSVKLGEKTYNSYKIAKYAFYSVYSVKNVYINSGITAIDYRAFNDLAWIVLHNGYCDIDENAFVGWFTVYFRGDRGEYNYDINYDDIVYYYVSCVHEDNQWTERNGEIVTQKSYENEVVENATCTQNGQGRYYCEVCDYTYYTYTIVKMGHTCDSSANYACERCDYIEETQVYEDNYDTAEMKQVITLSYSSGFKFESGILSSTNQEQNTTATITIKAERKVNLSFGYLLSECSGIETLTFILGDDEESIDYDVYDGVEKEMQKGQTLTIVFTIGEVEEEEQAETPFVSEALAVIGEIYIGYPEKN